MADVRLSAQSFTTTTTGARYYIIIPDAGSPSGYESYQITDSALKADINTELSSLDTRVTTNAGDIATINSQSERVLLEDQNSDFTFSQDEDTHIYNITFRTVSGTPIVKIGTSLGADDILSERAIGSTNYRELDTTIFPNADFSTANTIYVGITGGVVDMVRYSRTTVFGLI
jgi:hypothetical protein